MEKPQRVIHFGPEHQSMTLAEIAKLAENFKQVEKRSVSQENNR